MLPPSVTYQTGRVQWDQARGRSYVKLSWNAVTNATGYAIFIHDGYAYRGRDLGNVTSWDSRTAKIFPAPSALPEDNSVTTDLFRWDGTGLDFEDSPARLYRSTAGTAVDSHPGYHIRLTAKNQWMETHLDAPVGLPDYITLPGATDAQVPAGQVSVTSKEGTEKTYDPQVLVSFGAGDSLSGVKRIGLSNDNAVWTWHPFFRAEFDANEEEFLVPWWGGLATASLGNEAGVSYLRVTNTGSTSNPWHGWGRYYWATNIVPGQSYYFKIRYRTGNYSQGSIAVVSHFTDATGNDLGPWDYGLPASSSWSEKTFVQTAPSNAAQKWFFVGFNYVNNGAYVDVDYIEFGPGDGSRVLTWTVPSGYGTKTVYLRAEDCVGNSFTTTDTITLAEDVLPPTITLVINGGAESTTSPTVTLTVTAIDNLSAQGQLRMRFSNNRTNWSSWEAFAASKSWDITASAYGGTSSAGIKTVYVQVKDEAENVGLGFDDIGYNPSPPSGSVAVQGGVSGTWNGSPAVFATSDSLILNLSFSGASAVRIDPGTRVWGDWEAYAAQKNVDVLKNQGPVRIRVQVKDSYGVPGPVQELLVVIDPAAPVIQTLRGQNGATATTSGSAALELSATDNLPGTLQWRYQVNGGAWTSWGNLSGTTVSVSGLAVGANTITVQVKDAAGNVAQRQALMFRLQ